MDIAGATFDTMGALLGILLLIFAAGWLLKKVRFPQAHTQHLRVISVLPLSNRERVILMQAGEDQVLMGVSTAGIQHLHTLGNPVENPLADQPAEAPSSAFRDLVETFRSRTSS